MEKIAESIGSLCVCVFVMGLIYEIGAFEKTAKVIKFVISIYIVITVINSLDAVSLDIHNTNQNMLEYQENYNHLLLSEITSKTQTEIETVIKKRLKEKNIAYNSVKVHILEQNGNLTADEINIDCENIYIKDVVGIISDIADENTKLNIGE